MQQINRHKSNPADIAVTLAVALLVNEVVKIRVGGAASQLASAGAFLENQIAKGDPELSGRAESKARKEVEDNVQEFADDLDAVNVALAEGVAALENTKYALATARKALVDAAIRIELLQRQSRKSLGLRPAIAQRLAFQTAKLFTHG